MIANKTIFVLGAGASKAYGFPLGKQLLTEIETLLHREEGVYLNPFANKYRFSFEPSPE